MDAWITTSFDEKSAGAAAALGKSLRQVSTRIKLILVVPNNLPKSIINACRLSNVWDDLLQFDVGSQPGLCLEEEARKACLEIKGIRRGIFLAPYLKLYKNFDNAFDLLESQHPFPPNDEKAMRVVNEANYFGFLDLPASRVADRCIVSMTNCLDFGESIQLPFSPNKISNEPIAVVGMSCRFPKARNVSEYWNLICSMEDAIELIPPRRLELIEGWDSATESGFIPINIDEFDGSFFEMGRLELNVTDPQQRLALEVSWEALEDARINPLSLEGSKLGVFSGSWGNDYKDVMVSRRVAVKGGTMFKRYVGNGIGAISGRLSYFFGGVGPSIATESACSSAMAALALAITSLRDGTSDMALSVGSNLLLFPFDSQEEALHASDSRCKTFEEAADGYGRAEGIATLVLKRLSDAVRDGDRVHSVLLGFGSYNKPLEGSIVTPEAEGESYCLQLALDNAKLNPQDVQYIEFHGTGTATGDFAEFQAVSKVYDVESEIPCYIASAKANIGHTESCSGLAGIVKMTCALKEKVIAPHRKIRELNKKLDMRGSKRLIIPQELSPWEVPRGSRRIAGVNAFGVLGSYYHVILGEFQAEEQRQVDVNKPKLAWNIVTFSARSEESLKNTTKEYLTFFGQKERPALCDIAFSSATTRAHLHPFRASLVVSSDWNDFEKRLRSLKTKECGKKPKIVFLFTGQGSQWVGMGRQLYASFPEFQRHFDRCDNILRSQHDVDIRSYLWGNPEEFSDSKLLLNQTSIFVMEFCTSSFLETLGITPFAVLGHSLGEYAAACVSGIISLKSALALIVKRARLLLEISTPGNSAMLAVLAGKKSILDIQSEFTRKFPDVTSPPEISAMNAEQQIVLGGPELTILRAKQIAEEKDVACVPLKTSHAFHSSLMDPILDDYFKFAATIPHSNPQCKFVSSVSGWTRKEVIDNWAKYWVDVTRKPVDFLGACESGILKDIDLFLEVGPNPILSSLVSKNIPRSKTTHTMKRSTDEIKTFSESLAMLYNFGCDIAWKTYYAPFSVSSVDLPLYQFNRKSYWMNLNDSTEPAGNKNGTIVHPLLGSHTVIAPNLQVFDAVLNLSSEAHAYLGDHTVGNVWLFPATGFLEIALSTVKFLQPTSEIQVVENLEISNALGKASDGSARIQTVGAPNQNSNSVQIQVFSTQDNLKWKQHASCSSSGNPANQKDISAASSGLPDFSKLTNGTSTVDWYESLTALGYTFGPYFQRLEQIWKLDSTGDVYKINTNGLDNRYTMHPVIADSMLFVHMNSVSPQTKFSVPTFIRKFTVFQKITQDHLYIHAKTDPDTKETKTYLVNASGEIFAILEGLTVTETSINRIKQSVESDSSDDGPVILKQIWEKKSLVTLPVQKFKIPTENLRAACSALETGDKMELREKYPEEVAIQEEIISLYYQKALRSMGFQMSPGDSKTFDEITRNLSVVPNQRRFFNLILQILCEDQVFKNLGQNKFQLNKNIPEIPVLDELIQKRSLSIKDTQSSFRTLEACLKMVSKTLSGENVVLPILFPENDSTSDISAESFYNHFDLFQTVHEAAHLILQHIFESRKPGSETTLRFLEVGGGTGAATVHVISLLESLGLPYFYQFTDISSAFFPAIRKRLEPIMTGGKGVFDTKTFDLEADALSQGFRPFDFDVVVASFVLHATSNLKNTCLNLRKLSKGFLCIMEANGPRREVDAVFAHLEGYWLFNDDIRTDHANVSGERWSSCLESCGFETEMVTWSTAVILLANVKDQLAPVYKEIPHKAEVEQLPTWVLYIQQGSLTNEFTELIDSLRNTGRNVALVENPADFENRINSSDTLEGILYAGCLQQNPGKLEDLLKPFLHLMQTVVSRKSSSFPRIVVPMTGAWFLEETDEPSHQPPFVAAIWGICKTLRSEYPAIRIKTMDIDTPNLPVEFWLNEIFPIDDEPQIAIRKNERTVLRLIDATRQVSESSRTLEYPSASSGFQLSLPKSCVVSDLSFVPIAIPEMKPNQLTIQAKAVGLNFKDVLCVLKPSDFFKNQNAFGLDVAGTVTKIGSQVNHKNLKLGDRVVAVNMFDPFASSIVVDVHTLLRLPSNWSMEEGATVIAPFVTAYYCLLTIAKMTPNDTLLIHTGTGGVGLAAIQLAQIVGAKIVATAGSPKKRAYLRSLGIQLVYNSRNLDFSQNILRDTNGRGVDIVLNSLTGEGFIEASLKACNKNARFVEMSKLNIWTEEEVHRIKPNVKYDTVYIADLEPAVFRRIADKLEDMMESGEIRPLRLIEFPCNSVIAAVKFMQEGKHMGKVVLKMPVQNDAGVFVDNLFSEFGMYLITGGFGGIGIEVAKWMVENGARNFILSGRNPNPALVKETLEMLQSLGAQVVIPALVDVGNSVECKETLKRSLEKYPAIPLKGIFHCAGVLSDATFPNQTLEKFQMTLHPKWTGTWNLHQLTEDLKLPLDYFVMFSSTAAIGGALGQANHTVANAAMDAIAWYRHSFGLPATTINWGQWGETGVVAGKEIKFTQAFSTYSALMRMEQVLRTKEIQLAISSDFRKVVDSSFWAYDTYFCKAGDSVDKRKPKTTKKEETVDMEKLWKGVESYEEKYDLLKTHIVSVSRVLLELEEDDELSPENTFTQLGLDSLLTIQLKNKLIQDLKPIGIPETILISNTATVTEVIKYLLNILEGNTQENKADSDFNLQELIQTDSKLPLNFDPIIKTFPNNSPVSTILLTGATGHLGSFILHNLCSRKSIHRIYCLVRSHRKSTGLERIKHKINQYKLSQPDWNKVTIVEGVLSKDKFGVDESIYQQLTSEVDGVIHLAAKINHLENYGEHPNNSGDDSRSVNVLGVQRILQFTSEGKAKKLYYASSVVASRLPSPESKIMNESWPSENEFDSCSNVAYPMSKFVAERLLMKASQRGLNAFVFRLPFIGGDSQNGLIANFEENHLMLRFLSYFQTGVISKVPTPLNLLPVDVCADFSLEIFLAQDNFPQRVFNVMNPHAARETDFIPIAAESFGVAIKQVEMDDYVKELQKQGQKSAMMPLLEFYNKNKNFDYLTGSPMYPAWLENEADFFKSNNLIKILQAKYLNVEDPITILTRDLKAVGLAKNAKV